jgi:metallophosphoesterase superfamily enzyme
LRQNRRAIVFNGDYIDRGENSVEVLLTLLLIKLAYRDNVILVRGNHECAGVASVYGF